MAPTTAPHPNPLNIYKGPQSMTDFFNPDHQPPLPMIELPDSLNPFRGDNVRIYAKMATALPAQNIKCLPALNMLLNSPLSKEDIVIEQSSGSTATSLSMVARVLYNNTNTRAFVSNKAGQNRIRQLRFFGLTVELYGGPTQPELSDPRGTVQKAHRLAEGPGNFVNPGQYDNDNNWKAHIKWTGPQIIKQLPEINVFCMAMGSAGCITGTGHYLKAQKPDVKVVGVCFPVKDILPGPRSLPLVEGCDFPWKEVVDQVELIGSVDAFRLSMQLSREGLIAGPSSGMILKGLYEYIQKAKDAGTLSQLADPTTGEISCVFVCCDLPYQYLDSYFSKLGEEDFPPVLNQEILNVDTNEYDSHWEITEAEAAAMLSWDNSNGEDEDHLPWENSTDSTCSEEMPSSRRVSVVSSTTLLDLRSPEDFEKGHIPGSINTPLVGLTSEGPSPFDDIEKLQSQWEGLKRKYEDGEFDCAIRNAVAGPAVLFSYDGETARLATSLLRAEGVEAYSIRGGCLTVGAM